LIRQKSMHAKPGHAPGFFFGALQTRAAPMQKQLPDA
jgi:hypothetical protein